MGIRLESVVEVASATGSFVAATAAATWAFVGPPAPVIFCIRDSAGANHGGTCGIDWAGTLVSAGADPDPLAVIPLIVFASTLVAATVADTRGNAGFRTAAVVAISLCTLAASWLCLELSATNPLLIVTADAAAVVAAAASAVRWESRRAERR